MNGVPGMVDSGLIVVGLITMVNTFFIMNNNYWSYNYGTKNVGPRQWPIPCSPLVTIIENVSRICLTDLIAKMLADVSAHNNGQ